jgi:MFS family permease
MNFGFFGIQYSFGLQQTAINPIYQFLGADHAQLPLLNMAGPVTGLLIQPLIGAMSDRTWSDRWGRRKPYFLICAIGCSICLFLWPFVTALCGWPSYSCGCSITFRTGEGAVGLYAKTKYTIEGVASRGKLVVKVQLRSCSSVLPAESAQEETRLETQDRRASQQAARSGSQGAPLSHSAAEV